MDSEILGRMLRMLSRSEGSLLLVRTISENLAHSGYSLTLVELSPYFDYMCKAGLIKRACEHTVKGNSYTNDETIRLTEAGYNRPECLK